MDSWRARLRAGRKSGRGGTRPSRGPESGRRGGRPSKKQGAEADFWKVEVKSLWTEWGMG